MEKVFYKKIHANNYVRMATYISKMAVTLRMYEAVMRAPDMHRTVISATVRTLKKEEISKMAAQYA